MTCYETLRAPAPAADAPMAHHFVKWWRNKFRNGYKKFSIDRAVLVENIEEYGTSSESWEKVAKGTGASKEDCQKQFMKLSKEAERKAKCLKKNILGTGGGPPPKSDDDPLLNKVKALVGPSIEGLHTIYDGDRDIMALQHILPIEMNENKYEIAEQPSQDDSCQSVVTPKTHISHISQDEKSSYFINDRANLKRKPHILLSLGTEADRTDTEELVGRAVSQCSAPPDLLPSEARAMMQTPPPAASKQKEPYKPPVAPASPVDDKPRLRFEELTCDVELQHPEPSKQQPFQFSFTLYDLDGHGRMTKDDIAGIVSTIYDSIGKSVTVPHYGSKTIQVRLTVVPDDGKRSQRERREGRRRRRRECPVMTVAPPEFAEPSDEEQRDRLSPDDDGSSKSSCSEDRRPVQRHHPRPHRHPRREPRERKHTKKRSGSLQRRELLEIIQANMEKNHMSFQASRKPSESVVYEEEINHKYQKHRNRSHTVTEKPVNTFHKTKSDNIGNGYLDLASGGDSHLCRYDRYLHAVICSSARHATSGYHQKQTQTPRPSRPHHHHGRSRSHDTPAPAQTPPRVLQIIFL